jgi:hypothetical protein
METIIWLPAIIAATFMILCLAAPCPRLATKGRHHVRH